MAYTIAESPLVKTALAASDPNWGRILAAIGRAGVKNAFDVNASAAPGLNGSVDRRERGSKPRATAKRPGRQAMQPEDIEIRVALNRGQATETVWTTDLTYEYVRINAEYRT